MIEARQLTKEFKVARPKQGRFAALRSLFHTEYTVKRAVNDISFTIGDGELVGYIGPNGAGKSTTIKMLSGILVPSSGEVTVQGLVPHKDRREHAKHIGVVFGQKTSLWWDVPVIDSLRLLKDMYQVDDAAYKKNLDAFADLLDLSAFINQPVRQLSLGQRMRADLAAALLHNPSVLFLDEPTIGVDVVAKEKLRQFILQMNRERGTTALLTTHDMADMEKLVTRVIVIEQGKLAYDGPMGGLRDRYGRTRQVVVAFEEEAPQIAVEGLTQIAAEPYQQTFTFDQSTMPPARVLAALSSLPVAIVDITIQQADIEDIIRRIYQEDAQRRGTET